VRYSDIDKEAFVTRRQ